MSHYFFTLLHLHCKFKLKKTPAEPVRVKYAQDGTQSLSRRESAVMRCWRRPERLFSRFGRIRIPP